MYIEHRAGANVSLTKQQADVVRHKQFTAFFADFFNQKADYKMNDSPHFKMSGFPVGEKKKDEFLHGYFERYF